MRATKLTTAPKDVPQGAFFVALAAVDPAPLGQCKVINNESPGATRDSDDLFTANLDLGFG